jgi:predicted amidohydrolase
MTMTTTTSTSPSSNNANGVRRAAIAQLRSTNDKLANLINVAKCAGWAKRHGAQVLFLPECLGFMGDSAEQTLKEADPPILSMAVEFEDDDVGSWSPATTSFREILSQTIANAAGGDDQDDDQLLSAEITAFSASSSLPTISIIDELRFIACKSKLWISGGGVHTKATMPQATTTTSTTATTTNPDATNAMHENKIYNTHVIINDRGQIQAHYHKIHLFDVSIPGKVELRESSTTSPGTKLVVCDSPIGKLGLSICYDMRFAEMYVELVQKRGAQVLLMPSAFTVPTGKAHWHALLKGE